MSDSVDARCITFVRLYVLHSNINMLLFNNNITINFIIYIFSHIFTYVHSQYFYIT